MKDEPGDNNNNGAEYYTDSRIVFCRRSGNLLVARD
jgi:hypothetical protein